MTRRIAGALLVLTLCHITDLIHRFYAFLQKSDFLQFFVPKNDVFWPFISQKQVTTFIIELFKVYPYIFIYTFYVIKTQQKNFLKFLLGFVMKFIGVFF
jgi:hypothetical protein